MKRRDFLKTSSSAMLAAGALASTAHAQSLPKGDFDISVAAWSWHKMFFAGEITQLDMPALAREAGATGLELVNQMWPAPLDRYVRELDQRANDEGIEILLIMCDGEGSLYAPGVKERARAIVNHKKWIDLAAHLGCHSVRTNAGHGNVPADEAMKYAADSFYELSEYARQYNMSVCIENHGGLSSDPKWLTGLFDMVNEDNFGSLPDFGNFPRNDQGEYAIDIYNAVEMLMPYAKAVSAKCYDFGEDGWETTIDYKKMMEIVLDAGYNGYVGVEFEGGGMGEKEGIKACVDLLKRFQA